MYRFFGEQDAYGLFNLLSYYVIMISSVFLAIWKKKQLGGFSKCITGLLPFSNAKLIAIIEFILGALEMIPMAFLLDKTAGIFNRMFGQIVGTGANYFAVVFFVPIFWSILSMVLLADPLKQIDIATLLIPIQLVFLKIACFFNGCCWGIPWEYGLYNHHYDHPGKQVPVQAIEVLFAVIIFIFLLFYRRKAKTGTIYPMFMILYGGTRFFSEFFTAAYPDIIGPFNMYQVLCAISVLIGLIAFFIIRKNGDKISAFFEKPQKKLNERISQAQEEKVQKIIEEKAQAESAEMERIEKIRIAREKAKARRGK